MLNAKEYLKYELRTGALAIKEIRLRVVEGEIVTFQTWFYMLDMWLYPKEDDVLRMSNRQMEHIIDYLDEEDVEAIVRIDCINPCDFCDRNKCAKEHPAFHAVDRLVSTYKLPNFRIRERGGDID